MPSKKQFIVRHGEDTPIEAWFLVAPRTWNGDKARATRFDSKEEAAAALDKMIEDRYSRIASKRQIKAVRDRCVIADAPEQETV